MSGVEGASGGSFFSPDMRITMPGYVREIIDRLTSRGFSAYAVGGAVRDCVLGLYPDDWDVASSALPEEIESAFSDYRVIETGIKHGTVSVVAGGNVVEITTFRKESGYSDNRHPDAVEFVGDVAEDLRRRDFTVNSLAYNEKCGLIDLYGGLSDIENKIIRTVGNAEERFSEDSLRILRAVRFSSKLGFRIEEKTLAAAEKLKGGLKNVSAERIFSELLKTLCGKDVLNALMNYREIIAEIVPEIRPCFDFDQHSKWHLYDVYEHIARATSSITPEPALRTAMFLHDIAKPAAFFMKDGEGHFYGHADMSTAVAEKILKRLKAPVAFREKVLFLIKNHDAPFPESNFKLKRLLGEIGEEAFFDLVKVKYADNKAQGTDVAIAESEKTAKITEKVQKIIESGECYSLKMLNVSGDELASIGFKGKEIGDELNVLLTACMETPSLNDNARLKELAEKHFVRLNKRA
ncbi:MAG: CCA tRNA nucleotidyltransferase [Clostridiales bacterium]|nr:CCA tRNA nucleotidyltransferase [Clostridiales bacterium]